VVTSTSGAVLSLQTAFSYRQPGNIDLVTPTRGQRGTFVTIHGTNLLGGGAAFATITLGGVSPLSVISATNTMIKLRAAASVQLGIGDVYLASDTDAVISASNEWTYDRPSNITTVCI